MKLLFCQDCGDIIAPYPQPRAPRYCRCLRHAVWWEDPQAGILRVHDARNHPREQEGHSQHWPSVPRAYVIGLTNTLLQYPDRFGPITAETVQEMIDSHGDNYLFKRWRSLVLRIRPAESNDTNWAALPTRHTIEAPPRPPQSMERG